MCFRHEFGQLRGWECCRCRNLNVFGKNSCKTCKGRRCYGDAEKIILVGCGKKKGDDPAPAKDLYTGQLFRKSFELAERMIGRVWILSAYYELVDPQQMLIPYNESLADKPRDVRNAWGDRIAMALEQSSSPREVTILAGRAYVDPIRKAVATRGYRWRILEPMKGMQIGERLQWLTEQLERKIECKSY